jgi:putative Mg2+ transporter-C (MgtC) family protein
MHPLQMSDVLARIGLALAFGLVLGVEREQHGRAAGVRTTMLVCVSAALAMLLSEYLFLQSSTEGGAWRPDPARLAAGVLAGMGFLGAGVIIRQDNAIHGVTTAAVLWFSAILGMALGSGFFMLSFIGFGIAIIALFVLPKAETYVLSDRYAHLIVSSSLKGGPSQEKISVFIHDLGLKAIPKPSGLEIDQDKRRLNMTFDIKVKNQRLAECQRSCVEGVSKMKGVKSVLWR